MLLDIVEAQSAHIETFADTQPTVADDFLGLVLDLVGKYVEYIQQLVTPLARRFLPLAHPPPPSSEVVNASALQRGATQLANIGSRVIISAVGANTFDQSN